MLPQTTHSGEVPPAAADTRPFGFWTATALVVGGMIGSGIFLVPSALAPFGWTGVAAWLIGTGGALTIAYTLARLAAATPGGERRAGGGGRGPRAAAGAAGRVELLDRGAGGERGDRDCRDELPDGAGPGARCDAADGRAGRGRADLGADPAQRRRERGGRASSRW